jgi:hypothetical protein
MSLTCYLLTSIKTGINCLLISGFVSPALVFDGFTQADREWLVRVGGRQFQTAFMQQVDKRFKQMSDMFYALAAIMRMIKIIDGKMA